MFGVCVFAIVASSSVCGCCSSLFPSLLLVLVFFFLQKQDDDDDSGPRLSKFWVYTLIGIMAGSAVVQVIATAMSKSNVSAN